MDDNEIKKRLLEVNERLSIFEHKKFLLKVKQQELNRLSNEFNIELKIEKDNIIDSLRKEMNELPYEERNWIIRLISWVENKNIV